MQDHPSRCSRPSRTTTRNYKPDAKSRTAWELATHLATSDVWFLDSIIQGTFNFDPDAAKQAEAQFKNVNDVVDVLQEDVSGKLAALRALPAEKLTRMVDFFGMMKMPAAAFLGLANNHSIHHRGQLAAYLRAMGSKVPAIYGGSADADGRQWIDDRSMDDRRSPVSDSRLVALRT